MRFTVQYSKHGPKDSMPMTNIFNEDEFEYFNIKDMYQGPRDGEGLQVADEAHRAILTEMCRKIVQAVHEAEMKILNG